ncbi:MAG TPA: hypothetical protein VEG63_08925 [Candidatus Acidoferrales bacterium]|nr:hypothetical protein [Candidatus Acidoferrales bacterium]
MKSAVPLLSVALIAAAWLELAAPAGAQQSQSTAPTAQQSTSPAEPSTPAPPTAAQIFERYAEVLGGRAAWAKLTSRVSRGTVRIEGIDGTGTMLVYERAPNQEVVITTLENGYTYRDGFDGKTGWEQNGLGKVKDLEGSRAADRQALADFYSEIDLAKIYPHPKMVGQKTADGRLANVVEACVPGGYPRLLYFDAESGLLFRTDLFENPLSPAPTTISRQDDYRDVDGIKYPFKGSVQGPGVYVQFRFTTLHHNVSVTDDEVAKPPSSSN